MLMITNVTCEKKDFIPSTYIENHKSMQDL